MSYWSETMQDDAYLIVADGWRAGNELDWDNKRKNFDGKLIPKALIVQRYFAAAKTHIENLEVDRDAVAMEIEELEEEHGGDDGLLADARNDKDKVNAFSVKLRLKAIKEDKNASEERAILESYLELTEELSEANKKVKEAEARLALQVIEKYGKLTVEEVKTLVVDDKWIATLAGGVRAEMQRISQRLTQRIKELAERYETPVPDLVDEVAALETRVKGHLERMGFVWN
jgi:type I restriction enzyme M protein